MGSDFLFAMPSVLSGAARVLDLGATFDGYNRSSTGEIADARALSADWKCVGQALRDAMQQFAEIEPDIAERVTALVNAK